jgi:hypothetical protein
MPEIESESQYLFCTSNRWTFGLPKRLAKSKLLKTPLFSNYPTLPAMPISHH